MPHSSSLCFECHKGEHSSVHKGAIHADSMFFAEGTLKSFSALCAKISPPSPKSRSATGWWFVLII